MISSRVMILVPRLNAHGAKMPSAILAALGTSGDVSAYDGAASARYTSIPTAPPVRDLEKRAVRANAKVMAVSEKSQ